MIGVVGLYYVLAGAYLLFEFLVSSSPPVEVLEELLGGLDRADEVELKSA